MRQSRLHYILWEIVTALTDLCGFSAPSHDFTAHRTSKCLSSTGSQILSYESLFITSRTVNKGIGSNENNGTNKQDIISKGKWSKDLGCPFYSDSEHTLKCKFKVWHSWSWYLKYSPMHVHWVVSIHVSRRKIQPIIQRKALIERFQWLNRDMYTGNKLKL